MDRCDRWLSGPPERCARVRGHRGRCLRQSALDRAVRVSMHRRIPGDLAGMIVRDAERIEEVERHDL